MVKAAAIEFNKFANHTFLAQHLDYGQGQVGGRYAFAELAYIHGRKAVDGVSLALVEGEVVGLVGPSGSGKTTLLNLIAGIDRPDAGTVTVAGTDLSTLAAGQLADWRAEHVGGPIRRLVDGQAALAFDNGRLLLEDRDRAD